MTDPGWLVLVNFSVLAATTILFGVNVWQSWRLRRRYRDLTRMERALQTRLEQVFVLDRTLAGLCHDALIRTSVPVWQAWRGTMGDIEVHIEFLRYRPGGDEDAEDAEDDAA